MTGVYARGSMEPDAAVRPILHLLTLLLLYPGALTRAVPRPLMPGDEGWAEGAHHREPIQSIALQWLTREPTLPAPAQVRPRQRQPVVLSHCSAAVLAAR